MAISISLSPGATNSGSAYPSLIAQTVTWAGLAATTTYTWSVVGPNGNQSGTLVSSGGGAATTIWNPDGAGTYTFYTTLISAAAAVPSGAFTVEAIN